MDPNFNFISKSNDLCKQAMLTLGQVSEDDRFVILVICPIDGNVFHAWLQIHGYCNLEDEFKQYWSKNFYEGRDLQECIYELKDKLDTFTTAQAIKLRDAFIAKAAQAVGDLYEEMTGLCIGAPKLREDLLKIFGDADFSVQKD